MDAVVGKAYTVNFDLIVGIDYVSPDAGSMTYSVRDNAGAEISDLVDLEISDEAVVESQVTINVPSSAHTLASGRDFEQRTVVLDFSVDGKAYRFLKHYYVTSWLNYRVAPASVIALLGLKEGEVWQDQVDLVYAYFHLKGSLTEGLLETALTSGTVAQIRANDAIRAFAALDMMTGIELKALRKAGGDALSYQRFEKVDFAQLRAEISERLRSYLETLSGTPVIPTVFQVITPTNAITGA